MVLAPFPSLPLTSDWSAKLTCAHKWLANACANVDALLAQDDNEPLRFKIYIEKLTNDCLPLLEAMELMESDVLPREWIEVAAKGLGERVVKLRHAMSIANEQCDDVKNMCGMY